MFATNHQLRRRVSVVANLGLLLGVAGSASAVESDAAYPHTSALVSVGLPDLSDAVGFTRTQLSDLSATAEQLEERMSKVEQVYDELVALERQLDTADSLLLVAQRVPGVSVAASGMKSALRPISSAVSSAKSAASDLDRRLEPVRTKLDQLAQLSSNSEQNLAHAQTVLQTGRALLEAGQECSANHGRSHRNTLEGLSSAIAVGTEATQPPVQDFGQGAQALDATLGGLLVQLEAPEIDTLHQEVEEIRRDLESVVAPLRDVADVIKADIWAPCIPDFWNECSWTIEDALSIGGFLFDLAMDLLDPVVSEATAALNLEIPGPSVQFPDISVPSFSLPETMPPLSLDFDGIADLRLCAARLVGHWSMADGGASSGTLGSNLAIHGTFSAVPGPDGVANAAVQVGASSYAVVPYHAALAPTAGLSVAAHVQRENWASPVGNSQSIVSKTHGGGYALYLEGTEIIAGVWIEELGRYEQVAYDARNLEGWHHFAMTFDGEWFILWMDGIPVRQKVFHGQDYHVGYAHANALILGGEAGAGEFPDAGHFFQGSISDVRVYDRRLTWSEMLGLGAGIADWNMDPGSTIADEEGHNGTLWDARCRCFRGNVTKAQFAQTSQQPAASLTHVLQVRTDGQHVEVPTRKDLAPTEQLTVAAWVRRSDWRLPSTTSYDSIVSKTQGGGYGLDHSGHTLRAQVRTEGGGNLVASFDARELTSGWHHVAATYNGSMLKLYVDGRPVAEHASTQPASIRYDFDNSLMIGGEAGASTTAEGGHFFRGDVGRVQLFRWALDPAEIEVLKREE